MKARQQVSVSRSVCSWGARLYLCLYGCTKTVNTAYKTPKDSALSLFPYREKGKSYVIYRHEMIRLLTYEKSAHDQLFFEEPCLMGFRSKEVTTLRLEHCDFMHEECLVLDAKKHKLFPVHLSRVVAAHVMECAHGRTEGLVIENESTAWRGRSKAQTNVSVWYKWRKYAKLLHLYPSPKEYSPVVGRRFFIAETLRVRQDEPLAFVLLDLMRQVRHSDWRTLFEYASRIRFYEDGKAGFDKFQNAMEKTMEDMNWLLARQSS